MLSVIILFMYGYLYIPISYKTHRNIYSSVSCIYNSTYDFLFGGDIRKKSAYQLNFCLLPPQHHLFVILH